MRTKAIWKGLAALVVIPLALYILSAIRYSIQCSTPRKSCLEHRQAGCSINGDYNLTVARLQIEATCDMHTDGGGWTLVANYLHKSGVPGGGRPWVEKLPLLGKDKLGEDENATRAWGHASNLLLSALPFREMRFNCQTSAHTRKVDFILYSPSCLAYFRSGKGSCLGTPELQDELRRNVRTLEDHDAHLPLTADKGHKDSGDSAFMDYPFFIDWRDNWSISDRWQCDDTQPVDKSDTHHQVWIR